MRGEARGGNTDDRAQDVPEQPQSNRRWHHVSVSGTGTQATGACRLCGSKGILQQSHIIPKFVVDWMKATGGRYFRLATSPNLRRQDFSTVRLLCRDCEQRFSALEHHFARAIFQPVVNENRLTLEYDASLIKFLVSVLWRVLATDLDKNRIPEAYRAHLEAAEAEWRGGLLGNRDFERYGRIHMFVTEIALPGSPPANLYLTRHIDTTVAASSTTCFVYAKFARFITWADIVGLRAAQFRGTLVHNGAGLHRIGEQQILDGKFGSFILERATTAEALADAHLSEKQREVIAKEFARVGPEFFESELWEAKAADLGLLPDWRYAKVGRNEPCPCGSGRKFKRCHGR